MPFHRSRDSVGSVAFLLLFSLFAAAPAHAWGSKGHEIIAALAETHLTDAARKRIKELLPQGTTLADAFTWPDKAGRQIPAFPTFASSQTFLITEARFPRSLSFM
jgi:S1/P1 Nuclease